MLYQIMEPVNHVISEIVHWGVTAPMWQINTAVVLPIGGIILYAAIKLSVSISLRKFCRNAISASTKLLQRRNHAGASQANN